MVLNRNVDNFFAETEQVAFHPGHVVPGIDFTNDPLLQGRLFSYTDTQLIRLGGPNFHELEINRPRCPMRNFQRDGVKRQNVPTGRVAYEPNSLDPAGPRESAERGFATYAEQESGDKQRIRPESFADHYSQARQFFRSMSEPEQRHIVSAFAFELGKVETVAIRKRMLGHLMIIERTLGAAVEEALGMVGRSRTAHAGARSDRSRRVARPEPDQEGEADAAGPQGRRAGHRRRGRRRARCAPQRGREGRRRVRDRGAEDRRREDRQGQARRGRPRALQRRPRSSSTRSRSLPSAKGAELLAREAAAIDWVRDAFGHLKVIGTVEAAGPILEKAAVEEDAGVVDLAGRGGVKIFIEAARRQRVWEREPTLRTPG